MKNKKVLVFIDGRNKLRKALPLKYTLIFLLLFWVFPFIAIGEYIITTLLNKRKYITIREFYEIKLKEIENA